MSLLKPPLEKSGGFTLHEQKEEDHHPYFSKGLQLSLWAAICRRQLNWNWIKGRRLFLAEGIVDRVLVLCPSTTIEDGLMRKFRELAANADLCDLLPRKSKIRTPSIINADQTITEGSICVENYHAVLEHVGSSIRESLKGKGERVAVLNDEAHHVANESAAQTKKWKEFLTSPDYGFRYILGVSGTCYLKDEYFSDVIFRYSLRQAMEDRYVKKVE